MSGWRGPTAIYGGADCPICHNSVNKGDLIARWRGRYAHKRCVERRYGE